MSQMMICDLRNAVLIAWSKSRYRERMQNSPRKKCAECFDDWINSGHDAGEFPYFFPLDYEGLCPLHEVPLADPYQ